MATSTISEGMAPNSKDLVLFLLMAATVLCGLMAGFFFAYSASVVIALQTMTAEGYTNVMQPINANVRNAVFGVVFFGAVATPALATVLVLFQQDWKVRYGQLFIAGFIIYLIGTFLVTVTIHIPMNEYIATWSASSPPSDWATVRARWALWNHVRTSAAIISLVLYLSALMTLTQNEET